MSSGSELRVHKLLNLLKLYQVNVISVSKTEGLDLRYSLTTNINSIGGYVERSHTEGSVSYRQERT